MSLGFYVGILSDERRIDGVREGLASAVQPGDKVLEVGTGLGTFAFFAVQAGADHVWAVDRDPVIHVARMLSRTNGLHERVTFLRGEMSEIQLPGQVDLIVFEDFAVRLLDAHRWRLMRDAQKEHLRPGGRVFPEHVRLNISLAGGNEVEALLGLGDGEPLTAFGLDWSCLGPYLANSPRRASVSPEALVGTPHVGPEMSLATLPTPEQLGVAAEWTLDADETVHALAMWFDVQLAPDRWYDNAPGSEHSVWGQTILPVFPPLEVRAGEPVRARVRPERHPDGAPGWLSWSVESGDERRHGHEFAAEPASLEDLYGDTLVSGKGEGGVP